MARLREGGYTTGTAEEGRAWASHFARYEGELKNDKAYGKGSFYHLNGDV